MSLTVISPLPPPHPDTPRLLSIEDLDRHICRRLSRQQGALQNEERLQELIAAALTDIGVVFEREKRFGPSERVDFWIPAEGIAIEIKRRMAGLAALAQVGRYLGHPEVKGAVVIAMRFSETIPMMEGKPIRFISLWKFSVG